jgi:hypothetical protein
MEFTIGDEGYTFIMVLNESDQLIGFTATKNQTIYDCTIHLVSQTNSAEILCCRPNGECTSGPC